MRKTSRSLAIAILASLAPVVVPLQALGQASGTSDPTVAAARARFAEGVQFYDKGQFENARASFLQAYALHKHPAVLVNLAQSSLRSGHPLDADRYFTRYLRDSPSLTAAQRAEAEQGIAEARTKLGRIEVSAPAGIAVTIDGEVVSTEGSTASDVEPGVHSVKGAGESTQVTVVAGQTVPVKLGKGGAASLPAPAVAPEPSAPPMPQPVPVLLDEPAPPPPTPATAAEEEPGILSRPASLTPVIVGAGVSVVGFVTAIALGVSKSSAQSSYNSEVALIKQSLGSNSAGACVHPKANVASACQVLSSDGSDVNGDATGANVGIAAGLIGAGFAAGWYLFAPKQAKSQAAGLNWQHVQPRVGPGYGGLTFGGDF